MMQESSKRVDQSAAIETDLVARAWKDKRFRQRLLRSPRATIDAELQKAGLASLPPNVTIRVVEETADTVYLVLPHHWTAPARTVSPLRLMEDEPESKESEDEYPSDSDSDDGSGSDYKPDSDSDDEPDGPDTVDHPLCTSDAVVCPDGCCAASHTYTSCLGADDGEPEDEGAESKG